MRHSASALLIGLLVAALLAAPSLSVHAVRAGTTSPITTPADLAAVPKLAGAVTDEAGVVGNGRGALESALADLLARRNVQLYALFVATTAGEDPSAYAQATFEQNGLGGNDLLVVVAVQDRRFAWWEESAVPSLTSTAIDQLLSRTAEPAFRQGDYAGGVAAFAVGLSDTLAPVPTVQPTQPSEGGAPVAAVDGAVVAAALGAILLLVGAVVLWGWWRSRRLSRLSLEERDRRTGQLAREANAQLIAADDAIREANEDLGFAEAQFDDADVAPFRAAIAGARVELKAAFGRRQELDDQTPETPEERERMLAEILERSRRVVGALAKERGRVQALRDQESAAPKLLAAMPDRIEAARARIALAEAALRRLSAFATSTWHPVEGNVNEAQKRLDFASDEARTGAAALTQTPPQTAAAAAGARRAERALGEATALLDAIDRLAAALDDAQKRLGPEIDDAARDLAAARAALDQSRPDPELEQRLTDADGLLARAREQAGAAAPDVTAALQDARSAHTTADAALASQRDARERRAREEAALTSALRSAEANVAAAADYVATRRPGVGREARTRLAAAESHLETARGLASEDPTRALQEAGAADRLAGEAYRIAQSDFDTWDRPGPRPSDDLGKVILGGILLGNVLGGLGGRRGGGWGGTPWGMPGGHGGGGSWGGLGQIGGGGRGGSGSW